MSLLDLFAFIASQGIDRLAIAAIVVAPRRSQATTATRKRAEAANQAKSRFLATVSDEVRTPLNGITELAQRVITRLTAE